MLAEQKRPGVRHVTTRMVRPRKAESLEAFHYTGGNLDGLRSFIDRVGGGMVIVEHYTTEGPRFYVEDHLFGHSHEIRANTFWVYRDPEMESHTRETFNQYYELVEEDNGDDQ